MNARPDGYTLLLVSSAHAINATLYDNLSFNFIRDIVPVASVTRQPQVLVVIRRFPPRRFRSSSPTPRPIPERSTWLRVASERRPTCLGELFKVMTGVSMVHVPYRGAAQALTDLIGGQVQIMFENLPASIEYVRTGKLRALAVTTTLALGGAAGYTDDGRFRSGL